MPFRTSPISPDSKWDARPRAMLILLLLIFGLPLLGGWLRADWYWRHWMNGDLTQRLQTEGPPHVARLGYDR
jgi:hypothetical protein